MNISLIISRELKGWSEGMVASEMGLSLPDYQKLESGEAKITDDIAEKLSKLYGVDSSYFSKQESPMINHNTGEHSHSNLVLHPEKYIDCNMGIDKEVVFKLMEDRDKQIQDLQTKLAEAFKGLDK